MNDCKDSKCKYVAELMLAVFLEHFSTLDVKYSFGAHIVHVYFAIVAKSALCIFVTGPKGIARRQRSG